MVKFALDKKFIEEYSIKPVKFGFNGLGELTYYRTYSRLKEDGTNEKWYETIERVVNGVYSIQKKHIFDQDLGWNETKAQKSAQEMYDRIFTFKFLPPGRGLWACGTSIVDKGLGAALNNCGFISTKNIDKDFSKPFAFMMDMSMLGVGIGFDVKGEGKVQIFKPTEEPDIYHIPDTREGWVESLKLLLESYTYYPNGRSSVEFDYSLIRKAGEPIKTFGGVSSGAEPLIKLHNQVKTILEKRVDQSITKTDIADIMNLIGVCVVAGNVRRTAEIMFGDAQDKEYLDLKNYEVNPERASYGWTSNNSVFCDLTTDYSEAAKRTAINGEPGYFWLENAQKYGRVVDAPNWKDKKAMGCNPCQPEFATVLSKEGVILFKDLKIGDEIWSKQGWTKVINKWSTGIKPVYASYTTGGVFLGTLNHRVDTKEGKQEIQIAEEVLTIGGPEIEPLKLSDQIIADGLFLGDGYFKKMKDRTYSYSCVVLGEKDSDYFETSIKDYIGNLMQNRGTCSEYRLQTTITEQEKKKTWELTIPERYYLKDNTTTCSLLKGLYSADGSVISSGNSARVTYKTASKILSRQVQQMLSSIGIRSYITTNSPKEVEFENGVYLCKESYDVNISKDIDKFNLLIGFLQNYKNDKLAKALETRKVNNTDTYTSKIESKYLGDFEVFDITVDNSSHTYWTGGLSVSNCAEQTLEDHELCCLVETFPANHESLEDYLRTLKFAYLYGKSVTLLKTHNKDTNKVLLKNRRIGLSQTGIAQFLEKHSLETYRGWCNAGYATVQVYDEIYSNWLCVPKSIKTTSIKPSGTISLLAGATPGMHYPENRTYIRRIRVSKMSSLVEFCKQSGYKVEEDFYDPSSMVVEIPVKIDCKTVSEVSIWEQVALAVFIQKWWADNQVSCTVTFKPEEAKEIPVILNYYKYDLKAISFLPKTESGAYKQMPYEAITEEKYNELLSGIKPLNIANISQDSKPELYCDSTSCEIK